MNLDYTEALQTIRDLAAGGMNLGLERVHGLLAALGNPQDGLLCAHIGGTNGKGSVAAMLTAVARAAGLRVGTFTSPHLTCCTERFQLDGRPVSPERFAVLVSALRDKLTAAARDFRPTEFELHTALALALFRQAGVDLAVLEVGLGGRLDATNAVHPAVTVITNVALDHQQQLGRTVTAIAREKSGIIKPGVPVVTAAQGPAFDVLTSVSREKGSPLIRVGEDVRWAVMSVSLRGQVLNIRGRRTVYPEIVLPLIGRHQRVNAACAVAAAEVLTAGIPALDADAVRAGLAAVHWPGRCEVFAGRPAVVLDAAHNPAAAAALRDTLFAHFPGKRIVFVLGILADKDREAVVAALAPAAGAVVVTRPPADRAGDWGMAAAAAERYCARVVTEPDCRAALTQARGLAGPDGVVVVTGSIYLLGALRPVLRVED